MMKTTKGLFLALASVGLFACSNEDVVTEMGNNLNGEGVVTVKIVSPNVSGRSLVDATGGENNSKVTVEGTITVKLTAESGPQTATVELTADGGTHQDVKFWGVKNPQKIEAYINDGEKVQLETSIDNASAPDMQAMPKAIPAYGSSTEFTLNGTTEDNAGKKYEMYAATVNMSIPVARLEVSGIKHATHPHEGDSQGQCKYSELTIDGIYLDKLYTTQQAVTDESVTDYCYPEIQGEPVVPAPILWDEITAPNDFMDYTAEWPAQPEGEDQPKQAYAWNFFPGTQMPILKIYFAKATASDETNPVSQPRYAIIKSYNGNTNFEFEAGKIYRITDVTLKDKNIIGDEEGNTEFGVDVTVTEAQWTIVDTTGEWVE